MHYITLHLPDSQILQVIKSCMPGYKVLYIYMYLTEVLIGSCMMFAILDAVLCPVVTAVDKMLVAIHTHGRPGTSPSLFAITAFGDAMEVKLGNHER